LGREKEGERGNTLLLQIADNGIDCFIKHRLLAKEKS
jgi:hypothetical protein